MARIKYIYNTETCAYEPVKTSTKKVVINTLWIMVVCIACAAGLLYVYYNNFTPLKEQLLKEKNENLLSEYEIEMKRLQVYQEEAQKLRHRDDQVFRTLLDIEKIPSSVWTAGVGGTNQFEDLEKLNLERKDLIVEQVKQIEKLKGQLLVQSGSFDEIEETLEKKKMMWASKPAITPLSASDITSIGSGFRWRLHPIHKVMKFHFGVDIGAETGKPIYAAGDGKVIKAEYSKSYGNVVSIDHGYGYETRYAHMYAFNVKDGQRVKRGDIIGFIGSTGWSTAPHLHYEVIRNGEHIDPVPYLSKNLSPEQFQKLVEESNSSDIVLDY